LNERPDADQREGGDPSLEDRIARLETLLGSDGWAGRVIMRGTLPRVVVRDALPVAAAEFRYACLVLRGTPDVAYICLRSAGGTWGWRASATG